MQEKLKVLYNNNTLHQTLEAIKGKGKLGFVPTMGALHEGHISLINKSIIENEFTICSIFVNQKQFNSQEDFEKYPNILDVDLQKLEAVNCDFVFVPSQADIYPEGFKAKNYDLGNIENLLEGFYRPGHFQGVCIVVNRLLDLIMPSKLYLGRKDYQQCQVIQKMLHEVNLQPLIDLSLEPTIRDEFGLALSSRNLRLDEDAKQKAIILIKCLRDAKESLIQNGDYNLVQIKKNATDTILKVGFESVDYFEFVDETFHIIDNSGNSKQTVAILTAATINGIRLIDNIEILKEEYAS